MITYPINRIGPYGMMLPNQIGEMSFRIPHLAFGYGLPGGILPNPYDMVGQFQPQNSMQSPLNPAPVNQYDTPDFNPLKPQSQLVDKFFPWRPK